MTNTVISNLVSLFAIVFTAASYFSNRKKVFFLFQTLSNLIQTISCFIQGVDYGIIGTLIATLRTSLFYFFAYKQKEIPYYIVILFCLAIVINCIVFWTNIFDLFFMFGLLILTIVYKFKKLQTVKILSIPAVLSFIIFDITNQLYTIMIVNIIELIVIIIAITRFSNIKKKLNNIKA